MKFMRDLHEWRRAPETGDPMSGVANLFDTAMVFIAALLLALMTVFDARDLFSPESRFTILKKNAQGEMTLIRKTGRRIQAGPMIFGNGANSGTSAASCSTTRVSSCPAAASAATVWRM